MLWYFLESLIYEPFACPSNAVGIDQDVVQHDWLDHLYTVIRLGMLVMLLYFYTTVGRFAIVLGAGIFFWL